MPATSLSPKPRARAPQRMRMLRQLNLFGLDYLDVVVLAALADERPLLLIGPHGTAKSELLNRIAASLHLEHRHYNASLISFDDLLGYPVPDARRRAVSYLRTPGDLWDAESIFLDEISRCRPETQNKLFSVVHEKRVQGLALPRLRYRWAAMNPPLTPDTDPDEGYEGSLPLDAALADRFAYVVELPTLADLSSKERIALISHGGEAPSNPPDLPLLLERTRAEIDATDAEDRAWAAKYVDALVQPLADARFAISGRRAVMLASAVVSVQAAGRVLGKELALADCAHAALRSGLPQRAQGRELSAANLAAIHRLAAKVAGEPVESPLRRLRALRDPVRRVAEGLRLVGNGIDKGEVSMLVTEAFASLTLPRRYVLAHRALPLAAASNCLTAPAYELLAEPVAKVAAFCTGDKHSVEVPRATMPLWNELSKALTQLARGNDDDVKLGNVLLTVAIVERAEFEVDALIELDREWRELFRAPSVAPVHQPEELAA